MTLPKDSAYPLIESEERSGENFFVDTFSQGGLSKREHFASLCLQGLLSGVYGDIHTLKGFKASFEDQNVSVRKGMAACAVEMADALIDALNF